MCDLKSIDTWMHGYFSLCWLLSRFVTVAIVKSPVTLYAWSMYGIYDGILQLGLLHFIACLQVKWKEYLKLFSCDMWPQQWYAFRKNRGLQHHFCRLRSMLHTSKYYNLHSYLSSSWDPDKCSIQGTWICICFLITSTAVHGVTLILIWRREFELWCPGMQGK